MYRQLSARWRWCASLSVIVILGAFLVGCGSSARQDFSLNDGEVRDDSAEASAMFDDPWVNPEAEDVPWTYKINEGDQLEVVLFTHPEQSRFARVRPDGKISLPFVGDIQAAGREPEDLALEIQERYSEVLVNPRADVMIQQMGGRFYVLGEVASGGEFTYERPITIMQAIAKAHGYTKSARLNNLVLLRRDRESGKGFAAILNFREMMSSESKLGDIRLEPFDIVWVPKSNVARWNDFTRDAFEGVILAEDMIIKGWSLINFQDVFENNFRR